MVEVEIVEEQQVGDIRVIKELSKEEAEEYILNPIDVKTSEDYERKYKKYKEVKYDNSLGFMSKITIETE